MLRIMPVLLAACVAQAAPAQEALTQADLIRRLIDLDRLANPPPVGEQTGMFSSYDRASRLDDNGQRVDWDANNDRGQFIRREDGWDVMAEMDGPGAITRIWSANPHGQIRFILDGQVVVDAPFGDLFNGKLAPFVEPFCYQIVENGGQNCYLPIGYQKSCKVVIRNSSAYYQINTVSFPPGARVQTFSMQFDEAAAAAVQEVGLALDQGLSDTQLLAGHSASPQSGQWDVQDDEPAVWEIAGAGTIRGFHIALTDRRAPRDLYALHRCVLRIYWDGERKPSVEVPLIDFFGSGYDLRSYDSLPMGTEKWIPMGGEFARENQFFYCHFPMPFWNGATIEITNPDRRPIGMMLYMLVDDTEPPADRLRFNARFRREDPCQVLDYPILKAWGRGRLVGCLLNVDTPRAQWWGEGDDKVWIDGERFPSYFGTGTEDYLGDAWGTREHARPFQGVTRRDNPSFYGKNSAYRWHIADCIDFQRSIEFTMENWQHARQWDTDYSTIAYWYAQPGAKDFFDSLGEEDLSLRGLRIPGSMEIEGRASGPGAGSVMKEKYAGGVELSGGEAVTIQGDEPVTIELPSNFERVAKLTLRVHPRRAFETIRVVDANGREVGTAAYDRNPRGLYAIGNIRLARGKNPVSLTVAGGPVLDCWVLDDLPKTQRGVEAEDLRVVNAGGATVAVEDFTLDWSGGSQLAIDYTRGGQTVEFELSKAVGEGPRYLTLVVTRGAGGGRFEALFDGEPLGQPFHTTGDQPAIDRIPLGLVELSEQKHVLALRAADPAGARLGLDAVELMPARSPFAIEGEHLTVVDSSGSDHTVQQLGGNFSGGAQLWARPKQPGAWLEVDVPVAKAGRYKLSVVYTTSWDYGLVQTSINGKKIGKPVNTFGALLPGPIHELGTFDLPAGPLRIRSEVVDKSDESQGYYFGLDCILLEPADDR